MSNDFEQNNNQNSQSEENSDGTWNGSQSGAQDNQQGQQYNYQQGQPYNYQQGQQYNYQQNQPYNYQQGQQYNYHQNQPYNYQQQGYYPPQQPAKLPGSNAFLFGLLSLISSVVCCGSLVLPILFGVLAINESGKAQRFGCPTSQTNAGKVMGILGIVLGAVFFLACIFIGIFGDVNWALYGDSSNYFYS